MSTLVEPGQECPTCERRVPLPKTEKTPPSKKMAYWIPADIAEDHKALLAAAAKHLGCYEQPYYESKVADIGMALILQDASLKDFAQRWSE